jgi:hypothetical protein
MILFLRLLFLLVGLAATNTQAVNEDLIRAAIGNTVSSYTQSAVATMVKLTEQERAQLAEKNIVASADFACSREVRTNLLATLKAMPRAALEPITITNDSAGAAHDAMTTIARGKLTDQERAGFAWRANISIAKDVELNPATLATLTANYAKLRASGVTQQRPKETLFVTKASLAQQGGLALSARIVQLAGATTTRTRPSIAQPQPATNVFQPPVVAHTRPAVSSTRMLQHSPKAPQPTPEPETTRRARVQRIQPNRFLIPTTKTVTVPAAPAPEEAQKTSWFDSLASKAKSMFTKDTSKKDPKDLQIDRASAPMTTPTQSSRKSLRTRIPTHSK